MKKALLSIIIAGIWIAISEFIRNELLFNAYWTAHFDSLGLIFVTLTINGILWMAWSFLLAFLIYMLLTKFSFRETLVISWIFAFLMMWITAYNLQVLPLSLLLFAVPLSIIEVWVASFIITKISKK